jgi:hypothetical protein
MAVLTPGLGVLVAVSPPLNRTLKRKKSQDEPGIFIRAALFGLALQAG